MKILRHHVLLQIYFSKCGWQKPNENTVISLFLVWIWLQKVEKEPFWKAPNENLNFSGAVFPVWWRLSDILKFNQRGVWMKSLIKPAKFLTRVFQKRDFNNKLFHLHERTQQRATMSHFFISTIALQR